MDTIRGFVEHIVYRNGENGYTVLELVEDGEEITCVGIFPVINEGESIEASGEHMVHPSYGPQFKVVTYEVLTPEDEASIERYLGSGAISGIGPKLAARIVKQFGADTFRIMEEEPERLAEVKGISLNKAREFAMQAEEKKDLRKAMIFLQEYGINMALAVKIYQAYGIGLYDVVRTNPYQLADEMTGVGFKTADEIARRAGIHANSDFRIRSGIIYVLQQASLNGHTYLPQETLTRKTAEILEVDPEAVEKHYMDLAIERRLVLKEKNGEMIIYASYFYNLELQTAELLKQLNQSYQVTESEILHTVKRIQKETDLELDEMQVSALSAALGNGLLVITGGPGTGKTTIIDAIIRYFISEGMDIALAAPTGRAAKRMSEATGYEAKTIHRLLELNGGPDENAGFERNESNPLEVDVIIIDEMSMVDISLMNFLLRAIVPGTRLILVGDVNQLPSVGPGRVLGDIIDSQVCKVVKLTKIFRQASQSDIIVNAHCINRGEEVILDNKSRDFFFLRRYDANVAINVCIQLIRDKLPSYVGVSSYDIQVLTPMRKGLLGVERLNGILQEYLNPPSAEKKERKQKGVIFREGDKVMQIKNNYQLEWEVKSKYGYAMDAGVGVFNGDMGRIKEINLFTEVLTVLYDEEKEVEYPFSQLDEIELAYAVTIHKSQGSEYPAVVIPLLTGPRLLMNRNLLYTAVTRARSCVVMVGDEKTFAAMVENVSQQKRYSGLLDRLREDGVSI